MKLLTIDKKKSKYVAVIVKNDESTLEKIKGLPFDYYQMYDCSPEEIIKIKKKYNKKIIAALTVENKEDVKKYKDYKDIEMRASQSFGSMLKLRGPLYDDALDVLKPWLPSWDFKVRRCSVDKSIQFRNKW